jgi:hypothetical protein
VARYLTRWLTAVIEPGLEPATYAYYETMARLYVSPALGSVRLDLLQLRDVQAWLDQLPRVCQCCAQGKDAARPPGRQRCCAIGACCHRYPGRRTVQAARDTLRAALNHEQDLRRLAREQATARERAGDRWQDSDLVFTTRWGAPIEPRNFNRSFDACNHHLKRIASGR